MDPIAAFSSLFGGLGSLFGGAGHRLDPEQLAKYFGVGALNKDTQKLFEFLSSSKFGQFGQQNAALQGSLFGDELKRRGAAIGGSGVGIIASSAASATQAYQQGDFLSQLFSRAQTGASENLNARLGAYASGGQGGPSGFGALAGAIANAGGQYSLLTGGGNPNSPGNARRVARNAVDSMGLDSPTIKKYNFSNLGSALR